MALVLVGSWILGVLCGVGGWLLTRRFRASAAYSGIGHPFPAWHGVVYFGGVMLILVGFILLLIAFMLTFL